MHVQVLSSGSRGNAALVRAGETGVLLDAGLAFAELEERLQAAGMPVRRIDHVALTHGHLDHARAAGAVARRSGATVHCCERLMKNRSLRKSRRFATLPIGSARTLAGRVAEDEVELLAVKVPHDADPTVAFRVDHGGRRVVLITDMGEPDRSVARALAGAHVVLLEFNHDPALLRDGPYAPALKRRVAGPRGHLSNEEAARMLRWLAGPELHTVVLTHLSEVNNRTELAVAAARAALDDVGLGATTVLVAEQARAGPNLRV